MSKKVKGNEVCFVVPFYGSFPPWFAGYLRSCSYNKSIDWLIFTDLEYE